MSPEEKNDKAAEQFIRASTLRVAVLTITAVAAAGTTYWATVSDLTSRIAVLENQVRSNTSSNRVVGNRIDKHVSSGYSGIPHAAAIGNVERAIERIENRIDKLEKVR